MKKFVIVLLSFVLMACSQKIILKDQNGIDLPKETIVASNPDTGITVQALLIRMVEVSPESYYPTYLSPYEKNQITMQQMMFTKEIMLFVRIDNPNMAHYRVTKRIRDGKHPENFTDKILFEGTTKKKHFQMTLPKKYDEHYQIMVMLDYGDRFPLLRLGYFDVLYKNDE